MDEPDPWADTRVQLNQAVEHYRQLAAVTPNPLYFWMALRALGMCRGTQDAELVLPGWCAPYFIDVAQQLALLAEGIDIVRDRSDADMSADLTNEQALKLIPQALGFSRQGYSAFRDLQETRELQDMVLRYDEIRAETPTGAAALEQFMAEYGLLEERTAQRRIAAGRLILRTGRTAPPSPGVKTST